MSTELPKTTIKLLEQASEKYEKVVDTINQQIEPLDSLLSSLAQHGSNQDQAASQLVDEIRRIGEAINKIGGHSAMWVPYNHFIAKYRYPPLGSILESRWHGIGTWQR